MDFKKDKKIFNAIFNDDLDSYLKHTKKQKCKLDNLTWDDIILVYGSKNIFSYHLSKECKSGIYNLLIDTIEQKRFDLMPIVLDKFNFQEQMSSKSITSFAAYFIEEAVKNKIDPKSLELLFNFYKEGVLDFYGETSEGARVNANKDINTAYNIILITACQYKVKITLPLNIIPQESIRRFLNHLRNINQYSSKTNFENIFYYYVKTYGFEGLSMDKFNKEFKEKVTLELL